MAWNGCHSFDIFISLRPFLSSLCYIPASHARLSSQQVKYRDVFPQTLMLFSAATVQTGLPFIHILSLHRAGPIALVFKGTVGGSAPHPSLGIDVTHPCVCLSGEISTVFPHTSWKWRTKITSGKFESQPNQTGKGEADTDKRRCVGQKRIHLYAKGTLPF